MKFPAEINPKNEVPRSIQTRKSRGVQKERGMAMQSLHKEGKFENSGSSDRESHDEG